MFIKFTWVWIETYYNLFQFLFWKILNFSLFHCPLGPPFPTPFPSLLAAQPNWHSLMTPSSSSRCCQSCFATCALHGAMPLCVVVYDNEFIRGCSWEWKSMKHKGTREFWIGLGLPKYNNHTYYFWCITTCWFRYPLTPPFILSPYPSFYMQRGRVTRKIRVGYNHIWPGLYIYLPIL
jgi:hypothetical protein